MEIGEKIKSLRKAKHMTQTELAGDQITRNMLSLVENGIALPSLPTIMYISQRLDVPAGMLLAKGEEEKMYKKVSELSKIKQAYEKKEYRLCYEMCKSLAKDCRDDEIYLILSQCCYEMAKDYFYLGKLHKSAENFDKACHYCRKTMYYDENILCNSAIYFRYMSRLSPLLGSDAGNENYKGECFCADHFCQYAVTIASLINGKTNVALEYVNNAVNDGKGFVDHVLAKLDMKSGDFAGARKRLEKLINSNSVDCGAIMHDIFSDLEECCRETEDYKGAYQYSVGKVELLERMLANNSL